MGSGFIRFGAWEVDEIHAIVGTFPDEAPLPLLCGFHQAHKLSKLKILKKNPGRYFGVAMV